MAIARRVMLERGLEPSFSSAALTELKAMKSPAPAPSDPGIRDLRSLPWASIDNDDSRDLDQLTVAADAPGGSTRILVAIADVDSLVQKDSAIDAHARTNTTSVYTAAMIFPMLPERLSTDLTSLGQDQDRLAVVVDMVVDRDKGPAISSEIYRAWVRNKAKLAYNSVAAWLEGLAEPPSAIGAVAGLADNLRLQDTIAQRMRQYRHLHGALSLQTIEARAVFSDGQISGLAVEERNRAKDIIEDFMIAANGETARFLASRGFPSIRRVVRTPRRWNRIVEIAAEHHFSLPNEPDPKALETFLNKAHNDDPLRFPDLSLSVIKLLGPGEYVAEQPGQEAPGHFGLAVKDYTHSTAPNRRFSDLLTQRLLKAALAVEPAPYTYETLAELALHCTRQEDAANKVERQVGKSAAALLLQARIGQKFDGLVTGAADKGTWVRLLELPVEGRLVKGYKGVDVGNRLRVKLVAVDVDRGYIDFERVSSGG